MTITLTPDTLKLLEERMRSGAYASADEAIRIALESLEGEPLELLDTDTLAAIDRADAQAERGEGMLADEAFARLRAKHFGR